MLLSNFCLTTSKKFLSAAVLYQGFCICFCSAWCILFIAFNMLVICLYLPCMLFSPYQGSLYLIIQKRLYKPLKATFDRCILYLCFVSFRKCKLEFTNWHFVFVLCIPFLPHYYGKTLSQIACIVSCGVFVLNRYKLYLATKKTNTRHLRLFCARNISSDNGEDTSRS